VFQLTNRSNNQKPKIVKETSLTYEDYAVIDDGNRYELTEGQLELMSPAPSVTHQFISYELQKNLTQSCESDYFIFYAPIDVILSSTEVRQPDIVLINRNRLDIISNRGIEGAPDLVIEILSPSTLKRDKIDKLEVYARFHIPEYWIVDPNSSVLEQFVLRGKRYELHDIYQQDDLITSPNILCVSFTMNMIMENIPDLSN